MTEEVETLPGWADERLDELFANLPATPGIKAGREAYASCLAGRKSPAAASDMLGSEFNGCRTALLRALKAEGEDGLDVLDSMLETLEAEIAADS